MLDTQNHVLIPKWPAPDSVKAFVTTRLSLTNENICEPQTGYEHFNLAQHVNDDAQKVQFNREKLAAFLHLPVEQILWLNQVHSTKIIHSNEMINKTETPEADASITSQPDIACCIMTADCLPVLFCNIPKNGEAQQVAAAHAGWRGLADGILTKTLSEFSSPHNVIAWIGPAISQAHFEVGEEVYQAFVSKNPENKIAFIPSPNSQMEQPKWLACLVTLAKIELYNSGINAIYGGEWCTYQEQALFYSYRRDGAKSGRIASLIMIK